MERKQVSIWRSLYSGELYEMPKDWMPRFGGWELQAVCFEDEIDKVVKERKHQSLRFVFQTYYV